MPKIEDLLPRETCHSSRLWCLEGHFLSNGHLIRINLQNVPARIGRGETADLTINQPSISRVHAEIFKDSAGHLCIKDCNSKNGTYVNYERLTGPVVLRNGDFVHLGSCEFRVAPEGVSSLTGRNADDTWMLKDPNRRGFEDLMLTKAVAAKFQPVVLLDSSTVFAYESLGRGNHPHAPVNPDELFRMAKRYGSSRDLSNMFRQRTLQSAGAIPGYYQLFINIHPDELHERDAFIGEMAQIHDLYPRLNIVVEIPESLIIETEAVSEIHSGLRELGYGLAYDDFGTGQSRLIQLADCPPDYLKFDRSLIQQISQAAPQRQKMVEMLVHFANDIGAITIAEGIETPEEYESCRQMGFKCGQGFLFGKPMHPDELLAI